MGWLNLLMHLAAHDPKKGPLFKKWKTPLMNAAEKKRAPGNIEDWGIDPLPKENNREDSR